MNKYFEPLLKLEPLQRSGSESLRFFFVDLRTMYQTNNRIFFSFLDSCHNKFLRFLIFVSDAWALQIQLMDANCRTSYFATYEIPFWRCINDYFRTGQFRVRRWWSGLLLGNHRKSSSLQERRALRDQSEAPNGSRLWRWSDGYFETAAWFCLRFHFPA